MEQDMFKHIGANISRLLEEQGKTQKQLAEALGISKQVMHKIVRGSKAINAHEIHQIAQVFNVSIESLINPTTYETIVSEQQPAFGFMGKIASEQTRRQFETLQEAIEQIIFLEELLDAKE